MLNNPTSNSQLIKQATNIQNPQSSSEKSKQKETNVLRKTRRFFLNSGAIHKF
jgi:hypothetical protein